MSEDVSFVGIEATRARIERLAEISRRGKLSQIESWIEFHHRELEILYARKKELGGCVCIGLSHTDDCPEWELPI